MFPLLAVVLIIGIYWIFKPYKGEGWRSNAELWKTNTRSHGWPYYYKMLYGERCGMEGCPGCKGCRSEGWVEEHEKAFNRRHKDIIRSCNIIYVE